MEDSTSLKTFELEFSYPSGLLRPCLIGALNSQSLEKAVFEGHGKVYIIKCNVIIIFILYNYQIILYHLQSIF